MTITRRGMIALLAGLLISAPATAEEKYDEVAIGPTVYQFPKSWQRQNPSSSMRALQFGVPLAKGDEGKIEFVVFKGFGGGVDANIARWVGQFAEKDGEEKIEKFEAAGMKIATLDISGTFKDKPFPLAQNFTLKKNQRMLAAVIETKDGPFFFKMVGPKKSITAQDDNWKHLFKTAKAR